MLYNLLSFYEAPSTSRGTFYKFSCNPNSPFYKKKKSSWKIKLVSHGYLDEQQNVDSNPVESVLISSSPQPSNHEESALLGD